METFNELLNYEILRWGQFSLRPSNLLAIALIWITLRILLWGFRRFLARQEQRRRLDESLVYVVYQIVKYLAFVMAVGLSLEALGFRLNIVLTSAAALFVGIGLGLQHLFDDFVSGLILLIDRSIKVNDIIEVDKIAGRVVAVRLRNTEILTRDRYHLLIPNSKITREKLINWTHRHSHARFEVLVNVAYNTDIELAKRLLLSCADEHPKVLKQPPPNLQVFDFQDAGIQFRLLIFTNEIWGIDDVKSDIRVAILNRFREHNIKIPFPQREIRLFPSESITNGTTIP